ncbi:MAG: hypothetical protein NUV80_00030 [Candidatus Berkelbacteria bacterium]|nr:hypothetical protein [Candidatus Berkelbacteria bacterium]MCR4306939.1 hypothetical protein [Candidatus Berkelbacteria bacterium]
MEKERFYKTYDNLPLNIREEVVITVNGEPITWRIAKLEIDQDTDTGKEILNKLVALDII